MKTSAKRTNPVLWEKVKAEVMREEIGGTKAGQWSARKAIIAVKRYKEKGGKYIGKRSSSNSLHKWIQQDWTTKSGKPSHITGERYLPRKAFKSLSKGEIASINRSKRRSMKRGIQYSKMPSKIASKVRRYRK
jgi:Family of unknown function (DUF5872)